MRIFKFTRFKAKTKINSQAKISAHRKKMRVGLFLATIVFGAVFYGLATANTPETEAIEPSDFNAGYLIDDSVFYNANTMTVDEIQAFLDERSPACDMWGTGLVTGRQYPDKTWVTAGTTRAQYAKIMREKYGKTQYHDPPYVCINKFYENPETHETLYETQGVAKADMKSAAQIIYEKAQEYSINPQVLLVMINKESLAWGDNWPLKYEYNTVMGYGCPDNAPCNEAYYGFYNQIQKAAWQLRYYREHPNSYRYKPRQINEISYHPQNTWCGTKQVHLENIATTSLYIYTPYTPNDTALRAYPGTGDACSSYGNRNFYMFFREWFGNTYGGVNLDDFNKYEKSVNYLGESQNGAISCSNSYCYKKYKFGYIISNNKKMFDIHGGIFSEWRKNGAEESTIGLPVSNEQSDENYVYQEFEKGVIYWTDKLQGITVHGGIFNKWSDSGGTTTVGRPTSNESQDKDSNTFQTFENGTIFWSQSKPSWIINNNVLDFWVNNGGEKSILGVSEDIGECNNGVCFQKFSGGRIYWSSNGVYDVRGGILSRFISEGDKNLGMPISVEIKDSANNVYQDFEKSRIYWNNKIGTWIIDRGARELYAKILTSYNYLGYPTSAPACDGKDNGCYQLYDGGRIYWHNQKSAVSIHGGILSRWANENFEWGQLGYPIAQEKYIRSIAYQDFENGRIYWSDKKGTWVLNDFSISYWIKTGEEKSFLGFPISVGKCSVSDICTQKFTNGILYSINSKVYDIHGGIYKRWKEYGGEHYFGLPKESEKISELGYIYQEFDRGTIYWSNTLGTWSSK